MIKNIRISKKKKDIQPVKNKNVLSKDNVELEFYAFISYKHSDRAPWAKSISTWAHQIYKYLEEWEIPTALSEDLKIHKEDRRIKPVFLDNMQMYAGDSVDRILEEKISLSKSLVVVLTQKLVEEQRELRMFNQKAYIYDEIDYMQTLGRPIIIVWVDKVPFDANSKACVPDMLQGKNLMVIDANEYRNRMGGYQAKRKVAAKVAASIFQTRFDVFWNWYDRKRKQLYSRIIMVMVLIIAAFFMVIRERNIILAYKLAAEANTELAKGNRGEAKRLAADAYKAYSSVEGLPLLMQQCLDDGIPMRAFDAKMTVNTKHKIYAVTQGRRWIEVFRLEDDSLLARFDGYKVDEVVISPDCRRIAGFTRDFLRVFDLEKKKSEPLMELKENIYQLDMVDFNASGSLILTQGFNCNSWSVYEIDSGRELYMDMSYPELDKWRWYEERATFGGTDSTLLVYGKISDLKADNFAHCKAPKGAEWKCCLYDLRKKDTQRSAIPLKIRDIKIPEGTVRLEAARNSPLLLMMGTEKYKLERWDELGHFNHSWEQTYGNKINGYSDKWLNVYKQEHPDTWNKVNVIQVLFSGNERYVALIDKTNAIFVLSTEKRSRPELWNGLMLDSYSRENVKHRVIGVSDDGCPIFYSPTTSQGGRNVYIKTENVYNTDNYVRYSIPVEYGFNELKGYRTKKGVFYLSVSKKSEEWSWTDISATSTRSFICRSEQHRLMERFSNLFSLTGDSIVETLSDSRKYVVIDVKNSSGWSSIILWNLKKNMKEACLNDYMKKGERLSRAVCFVSGTDNLLVCDYYTPRDENGLSHSGQLLMDVKKGEVVLRGREVYINKKDWPTIFILRKDSLITYDVRQQKITGMFPGELIPKKWSGEGRLVLIQEWLPQRHDVKRLFDCKEHRMRDLPDSLNHKVKEVSADGHWLLVKKSYSEQWLRVIDALSFKTIVELPELEEKFATFTPDSRFVVFRDKKKHEFCMYDIEQKQPVFTYNGAVDIKSYGSWAYASFWNSLRFTGIAISKELMAIASYGVTIIELRTGKVRKVFNQTLPTSPRMAFSPNGRYLLVENCLFDMEMMACLYEGLPANPIELTDEGIRYQNAYYHFASVKELYKLLLL